MQENTFEMKIGKFFFVVETKDLEKGREQSDGFIRNG